MLVVILVVLHMKPGSWWIFPSEYSGLQLAPFARKPIKAEPLKLEELRYSRGELLISAMAATTKGPISSSAVFTLSCCLNDCELTGNPTERAVETLWLSALPLGLRLQNERTSVTMASAKQVIRRAQLYGIPQ